MPDLRTRLIFAAMMSLAMSLIMSGWITWLNVGFHAGMTDRWIRSFIAAWPAAFTSVVLIGPAVQRAAMRVAAAIRQA